MPFTKEEAKKAGKKGGRATKRKHGSVFFSKNGKKGLRVRWSKKKTKADGGANSPL